jgi:protoporphyrinogen oxidase
MRPVILGGGMAGLSLAYFLEEPSLILEKEAQLGGLCRSFKLNGIWYDIGPHIMFSKHENILQLHTSLIETSRIRRSNKVFFKGRYVKYPFENELSALDPADRDYCLHTFLHNPYEDYEPKNMLQFFLKTFGEGITNLYLRPYNEKIWKFDPSYLDTQMVERIPKPPKQDIIDSAHGKSTEGYTHQLYFHYPTAGGYQTLIDAYARKIASKTELVYPVSIQRLVKEGTDWVVTTDRGSWRTNRLINCMPLPELFRYLDAPAEIKQRLNRLRYNSIAIVMVQVKRDTLGDNFAIYIPDKHIVFHRLSKLNALGPAYTLPDGGSTLMMEVTYRPDSQLAELTDEELLQRVFDGLEQAGFARRADVLDTAIQRAHYEYVVYDLDHRQNVDAILQYLREQGIRCVGRFAEFEYLNSDQVAERARRLAQEITLVPQPQPATTVV